MQKNLIVILGPTATGKTNLAANLAAKMDGEVISADSRQVYKGMDIGTGKDLADFLVEGKQIPYHLIDIVDAGAEYNVFEFQKDFLPVYENVLNRGKQAILCGGTGMYLESVLKGYRFLEIPENKELRAELELKSIDELIAILKQEKEVHNTTDTIYKKRIIRAIEIAKFQSENEALIRDFPKINHIIFGIKFEREERRERITNRLKKRFKEEGMLEEVKQLIENGVSADKLKFYGLEYKIITEHLLGEITYNEMFEKLNVAIHQFAKRQMTWFRKMERNGFNINWIDGALSLDDKLAFILKKIDE
ncbi:tRNA (adenosine(37)-N6)-dimethylallyltransferase MiaA [Vicingus serpentipes]|uniref:tRNA dimethylallyltransferase n=1 Tax=Vicingus serpentipes TaxID=1926625 RepID=A0A5C6RYK5_9FLAO|nr:tRNA (adenosine(37)-N6)-dimethylallyltransferase MiaA [Vicingus serpentipes]TXB66730.1 tRNA (adenosine(37)-N6)-dimethylallyltransferase MiaA [Vicingus serpentipes]